MLRLFCMLAIVLNLPIVSSADDKLNDAKSLDGTWLPVEYTTGENSRIALAYQSVVTIAGDNLSITNVYGMKTPLTGQFEYNLRDKTVDLQLDELDLTSVGLPYKLEKCKVSALIEYDGEKIQLALKHQANGDRPKRMDEIGRNHCRIILRRAPKGFKEYPKELKILPIRPDGHASRNVIVCNYMHDFDKEEELTDVDGKPVKLNLAKTPIADLKEIIARLDPKIQAMVNEIIEPSETKYFDRESGWCYNNTKRTNEAGVATIPYQETSVGIIVYDEESQLIGMGNITPWRAALGDVAIDLAPICRVKVPFISTEIESSGVKTEEHLGCYLQTVDGTRLAYSTSKSGELEFLAPAGQYVLWLYGKEMYSNAYADIQVPAKESEYITPLIDVPATGLVKLIGKPAPELKEIVAWKGDAVKLADLKGQVVLLDFWGYWCGPCIMQMPEVFKIHDELSEKGVRIIGIHMDTSGDVATVNVLDEKMAQFKKSVWKDRDLPFPVALIHEPEDRDQPDALINVFGISGFPSTVLIDREGKVKGMFHFTNAEDAIRKLQPYLSEK